MSERMNEWEAYTIETLESLKSPGKEGGFAVSKLMEDWTLPGIVFP